MGDDHEKPPTTPILTSGAYPVFRMAAEDLMRDLEPFLSEPGVLDLREQARGFLQKFEGWSPLHRPSDLERSITLRDFLDFNRQVREFLKTRRK